MPGMLGSPRRAVKDERAEFAAFKPVPARRGEALHHLATDGLRSGPDPRPYLEQDIVPSLTTVSADEDGASR